LTPDGVILVSINDENRARLELLMDEVFPRRRIGSLVWRTRDTTSAKDHNFSDVHEHILVYGGTGFSFNGRDKTQKKYKNPDNDARGPWNGDPLTLAFDRMDRENLYYPIQDPKTNRWYPCDENRVWAYATESRVAPGQELQAETMEEFIQRGQILFPSEERVVVWNSLDELHAAIRCGDVPVTPKRKRPLITLSTPDLEFWIGKQIGFGRPLFKKFWKDLRSHVNPVSSWIFRINEIYDDEDFVAMTSPQAGEGTEVIQEIFGSKVFQYPKPPALIRELLLQATQPDDIVLDFFAGSGTTGHAVLALNALDGGQRRFILCSSTEATDKEPDKNLCRDVCAERIRRVIASEGFDSSFAYLQLDKLAPGDAPFDADCAQAFQLLTLRLGQVARPIPQADQGMKIVVQNDGDGSLTVLCYRLNRHTLDALAALPARVLRVFSPRPASVAEHFAALGRTVDSQSLASALLQGQRPRRQRMSTRTSTSTSPMPITTTDTTSAAE
jgi:adenine-specific DNA-methyltransferase